jgi:glycosyltransferase involved in cell wall biosynthesis
MTWGTNRWGEPFGPTGSAVITDGGPACVADPPLALAHDSLVVASTPIWTDHLAAEAGGRRLIAYTAWETDRAPDDWVSCLNHYDLVLVPSRFTRDAFVATGLIPPVEVVPHISDVSPPPGRTGSSDEGSFVFYVIATWSTRKAILDVVEAYISAFTEADPVELVIHTTAEDLIASARIDQSGATRSRYDNHTWFNLAQALAGRTDIPHIELSTEHLDRAEIAELHARGDCFVSLSRGEGWGLGAFEAGAHGNPILVTGWGGTIDFVPPGYPYFVDYDLVPTTSDPPDRWWFPRPDERWAKARLGHAANLMRHVVARPLEARELGLALQAHIEANFASARVTSHLLDVLGAH